MQPDENTSGYALAEGRTSRWRRTWHRIRRFELADFLMNRLGTEWCGNRYVPGSNMKLRFKDDGTEKVVATWDDGGFIGFGLPHEWQFHVRTESARKIAWWLLWNQWVLGTWCGLRTAIYYWALHRHVNRFKQYLPPEPPFKHSNGRGCFGCQTCWSNDPAMQAALADPDLGKGDPLVDPTARRVRSKEELEFLWEGHNHPPSKFDFSLDGALEQLQKVDCPKDCPKV
jgi:hypothetical protein